MDENKTTGAEEKTVENTPKTKKGKKGKMHANPVDSTQKYAIIALIAGVVFAVAKVVSSFRNQNY